MNKKLSNTISLLCGVVAIVAMSVTLQLLKTDSIFVRVTIVLVSFFVSYLINHFIHEIGKIIVGKILGFKLISFRLLTSTTQKDESGNKIKGRYYDSMKYIDVKMNKSENRTRKDAILLHIGGGIFNAIFFIIFLVLGLVQEDASLKTIFVIFAINNLYILALTTLPLNTSYSNDGSYLLALLKDEASTDLFYAEMDYLEHIVSNSPTTFDINRFNVESFNKDNPLHLTAKMNIINNLIYTKKFLEAYEEISKLQEIANDIVDEVSIDVELKRIFLETMTNQDELANQHRDDLPRETRKYEDSKSITRAIESYAYNKFSKLDEYASEEAYARAISLFETAAYKGLVEEQKKFLEFLKTYRFIDKLN